MADKRIFITGGTRGFGKALAAEFLAGGHHVFVTGRDRDSLRAALSELGSKGRSGFVAGGSGDVGSYADLERLASEARAAMGGIDIWINNAGVNQPSGMVWEVPPEEMERVVRTDLTGALYGARAAFEALRESGGWIWFVEGHGSDGRIMDGLSVYGAAKRGLGYLWRALAHEARGTGVRIGALSPGIMATDFIIRDRNDRSDRGDRGAQDRARALRILNILADRPETVAAFAAPRILRAERNGTRIAWLTGAKIALRFFASPFVKRRIVEG